MIEVKITNQGIGMKGHAKKTWDSDGIDRGDDVVPALTCNLINAIENLTEDRIESDMDSGFTEIRWRELSEQGKLLVDSWMIGITAVNDEYHCILFQKNRSRVGVFLLCPKRDGVKKLGSLSRQNGGKGK